MDEKTDNRKIAVIFPGMGYHKDKPLLYHPGRLVRELGYEVVAVGYHDLPQKILGNLKLMREAADMAYIQTKEQLVDMKLTEEDDIIFIGKSIGTFVAAKYVHEHGLAAKQIWYTPVEATFSFDSKNVIAFIGEADPWSDLNVVKEKAGELGIPLYTYPDCNHSLESSDTLADVRTLQDVVQKTAEFLCERTVSPLSAL